MKRLVSIAVLFWLGCQSASAMITFLLDVAPDDLRARQAIYNLPELTPLRQGMRDLVVTRFWPLHADDVARVFGSPLSQRPTDLVLPVFGENGLTLSGLSPAENKSHTDLHAIGNLGYVEVYYQRNGTNVATVLLYHRADKGFVPLKYREPFPKKLAFDKATFTGWGKWFSSHLAPEGYQERLAWDKARFKEIQKWLDAHLPKIKDLGVVEVSESAPSRVSLDNDRTCLIRTRMLGHPNVTNDWYLLILTLESPRVGDAKKQFVDRSIDRPGEMIGFAFDGDFFQMTPKLKK